MLAAVSLAACQSLNRRVEMGSVSYGVGANWSAIEELDRAVYYNGEGLRLQVGKNDYIEGKSLDQLANEAAALPNGAAFEAAQGSSVADIELLETAARRIQVTGVSEGVKSEFVLVTVVFDGSAYTFVFSQAEMISDENLTVIDDVLGTIRAVRNTTGE
jgi:hypothetical protein